MSKVSMTFLAIFALAGCEAVEEKPVSERIKESCEREFGTDNVQSNDCQIKLLMEELENQQAGKMERAREGSR